MATLARPASADWSGRSTRCSASSPWRTAHERGERSRNYHIHVPAGATPKDDPSAGVTMLTALASAVTGRKVRDDLAMTGEITLRGEVLPVGGIREKLLAAARGGIRTVLIPARNTVDLEEVPASARDALEIIPIERAEEVLRHAFTGEGAGA